MKSLPIRIVLVLTFLLTFVSPTFAVLKAEPVSKLPLHQRHFYDTDLFTGTAAYSHKIPVPKGTNDLTPEVKLSYNSSGARDVSVFTGIGWQLQREYIERDVNFTPGSASDDKFRLYFQGGSYELVYTPGDGRYHTKEDTHLHIKKLTTGASNDSGEYWQIITKDGTKYRFGQATNSELMCNGRSYVRSWNLDQVEDVHGNKIFYSYTESSGASFLSKIEYNTEKARVIDFTYASNPYQRQVYVNGCNVTETSRLNTIQVKASGSLVRQFDLSYTNAENSQQLLTSVIEKGSDGTSALPATTFTYKPEIERWASASATWINNANVDVRLDKQDVTLSDVNGDGLLDIVKSIHHGGSNVSWKVLINQGTSWATTFETWVNNANLDDARLDRTPSDVRLIDVTGDSLPDIVKSTEPNTGWATWKVWKNTGSSWTTTAETWVNNASIDADLTDASLRLIDANGDGLTDIVRSWNGTCCGKTIWKVFKNTGSSWNTSPETWINDVTIGADIASTFVAIVDVNGDGLPDIIKTSYSGNNENSTDTWQVFKNTGSSWDTTAETWINNAGISAHLETTNVALSDANGDGLIDIVKSINLGSADRWQVLLNKGSSWSTTWEIWNDAADGMDVDAEGNNVRLADVNGDGLPDLVKTSDDGGGNATWKVWKHTSQAPDLLAKVTTSQGGTIDYDYLNSVGFDNTGTDTLPDLPFGMWVVDEMTEKNGMSGDHATTDITQYTYKDGFYDYQDREFRGFGEITTTEPNASKKQYVFHQEDGLKGRLSSAQTNDSQNNLYAKTVQTWTSTLSNGIYTVALTNEKQYIYDGTVSNPKVGEVAYLYDSYGNVTKISEKGDTSITTDDRFIYNEYVYNTTNWIVDTVKKTYKHAADDTTKVSETSFYYDEHTGLDDAPTKGNMTKEVKWLSGGTNPVTLYTYDTYGNVTEITDANNRATQFAFGTNDTTRTYPDSTTNAKNQTTIMTYDFGTGNLLTKTDPNGHATSYTYDVFGRITKEIKPYDTSTYPTVNYTYTFNGTAPESTLVAKREVSGATGTLDTYTFTDGFGRTVQVKKEAEDTTKQIVTDTFYDANGEIKKQTAPHLETQSNAFVTPGAGLKSTATTYDILGRITTVTNPDNTTNTKAYDHWVITKTNERSKVTKDTYNAFNKIIKVEEINGASTYTTTYTYNARDELTKITDAGANDFEFTYDTLGRKTAQSDPDLGDWTYAYDGVGNLTSQTDDRNITTTRTYDELNRVTGVNYPADTDISYTYDGNSKIGTLTSVTDAAGTISYTYDNRLRKTQEQRVMDAITWTTQLTYDALDRITSRTNPDATVATYTFNAQGETESLNGVLDDIDYNALNKITTKVFANNVDTTYTYNTTDFRLNRITAGTVFDSSYTYDAIGNVASIVDNLLTKTQSFGYDDLDRLTTASETTGYSYSYQYNAIGNLTKFTDATIETDYTYGQNAGVHAVTSSTEGEISYVIYDEGLENGWQDWSWSSTNNVNDTSHPNTGNKNLTWDTTGAYAGLHFHKNGGVNTSGYTNITFALRASQTGQTVQIQLYDDTDTAIGTPVQLTNYGGDAAPGNYKIYTIPLSTLGGSNRVINGFVIQDLTGAAQPVMYVDTVGFQGNGPTPTPTATATPTPTPQQNSQIVIYDDALSSGWEDWSWSSTRDFASTANPHEGTKSVSWTVTSGYAALRLHKSGGVSTNGYTHLKFAVKASQTGQQTQVQLYNTSSQPIGTPVQLSSYGGDPVTSRYKVYSIPLVDLSGENMTIDGFIIQDTTGSTQQALFIDTISLIDLPTITYVFDDALATGWQDWSWNSTNSFTDTSAPYAGSKNITWDTTAAYAGLKLHKTSNVSITGYSHLTLALRGTQSGQNAQVQLYDANDASIGSAVSLSNYGGQPTAGSYKVYSIPLSDLGGNSTQISGMVIQDSSGSSQPIMYVDSIGLVSN